MLPKHCSLVVFSTLAYFAPLRQNPGAAPVEGGTLHDPKGLFPLVKAQVKQKFCCFSLGLEWFPVMTSLFSLLPPSPFAQGALAEHLGQFWHCHTWVPAEGSVVFNMLVLLLYLSINKKFSCWVNRVCQARGSGLSTRSDCSFYFLCQIWFLWAVSDLWLKRWNENKILLVKKIQLNIWTN